MTAFIVEGRRFSKRRFAVEFAMRLAAEQDRSIDIFAETVDHVERRQRSWACRMHPPGTEAGYTKSDIKQPPFLSVAASGGLNRA